VKGNSILPIVDEEFREDFQELTDRVCQRGESGMLVFRLTGSKGTRRWIETHAVPHRDSRGEITGLLAVSRDISERRRAVEALRESERRLRTLMANLPGMAYQCPNAPDWPMEFISEGCFALTGYMADELMTTNGPAYGDLIHPDDRQRVWDCVQEAVRAGEPFVFEYRLRDKAGRERWVWERGQAVRKDSRTVAFLEGFIADISERKRAEDAVRASEARNRLLVDHSSSLIWNMNADGVFLDLSPSWARVTGHEPSSLSGKSFTLLVHPDDTEACFELLRQVMSAKETLHGAEYRVKHADGTWHWHVATSTPVLAPTGECVSLVGVSSDISERKQAEEERERLLHDTGERVKELRCMYGVAESVRKRETLEQVLEDVVALIPEGWQYPAITRSRIRFDDQIFISQPFEESEWRQSADIVIAGEPRGMVEVFYLEERPELDEGPFLKEERNLIDGIVGALSEGIEHRQAESNREIVEEHLRQAQKMEAVGTLAGGIAHDFNNILAAVIGYAELLRDELAEGEPPSVSNVDEILKAGDRARLLVGQILAFSRKAENERIPMRISSVIKEALKLMGGALPSTVEIRQDIVADSDTVLADPTQIHQVAMNLCTNAWQAMRETGGVLEVRLQPIELDSESAVLHGDLKPGPHLKLTVRDTGQGIELADLERIFEPFFTTKAKGEGTGMGLSVVHGVVKSHGGAISVESEIGKGTVFEIVLPRLATDEIHEEGEVTELPRGMERILLVDDEESLLKVGTKMLLSLGYRVTTREDGDAAYDAFADNPDGFDLVLTDLNMPKSTGIELARRILEVRTDMLIVLCTGYGDLVTPEKAKEIGFQEMLMKPLGKYALAVAVRRALDSRK
jgi:PAS domain S-box-containing protein